jgi:predicted dithiol-disulfide oxidoreductase (DUF899 family)
MKNEIKLKKSLNWFFKWVLSAEGALSFDFKSLRYVPVPKTFPVNLHFASLTNDWSSFGF